jgi:hypothetical protein
MTVRSRRVAHVLAFISLPAGICHAQVVNGIGTPNVIPVWTGSSTVSDSKLTRDQDDNVTAAGLLSAKRGITGPVVNAGGFGLLVPAPIGRRKLAATLPSFVGDTQPRSNASDTPEGSR